LGRWRSGQRDPARTTTAYRGDRFNPYSHAWFASHHPQILRGLDIYSYRDNEILAREQRKANAALDTWAWPKPGTSGAGHGIVAEAPAAKLRTRHADRRLDGARPGRPRRGKPHAGQHHLRGFAP